MRVTFLVSASGATFDTISFRDALLAAFPSALDATILVRATSSRRRHSRSLQSFLSVEAMLVVASAQDATIIASAIANTPPSTMVEVWFAGLHEGAGVTLAGRPTVVTGSAILPATFLQSGQQRTEATKEGQKALTSNAALIASIILAVVGVAFACLVVVLVKEMRRHRKEPVATTTMTEEELTTQCRASHCGADHAAQNWCAMTPQPGLHPGVSPGVPLPPQSASGIHLGLVDTPLATVPPPPNIYALQPGSQHPHQQRLRRLPPLALTRSMPVLPLGAVDPWRCPQHQQADCHSCSSASLPAPIPVEGNTFQPIPNPSCDLSLRAVNAGVQSPFMCMLPPSQRRPGHS